MDKNQFCVSRKLFFSWLVLILIFASLFTFNRINKNKKITQTKAETVKPIIGGQPADPGEWPFMAFIYDKKHLETHKKEFQDYKYPYDIYVSQSAIGGAYCGGTLISDRWILTAAHCLNNTKEETVYDPILKKNIKKYIVTKKNINEIGVAIGFTDSWENILKSEWEKRFLDIENIYPHISFSENLPLGKHYADIGLIKLKSKTNYQSISVNDKSNLIDEEKKIKILGWGTLSTFFLNYGPSRILQEVDLEISEPTNIYGYFFSNNQEKNPCKGDSGGPTISFDNGRWVQTGIIHGAKSEGCIDSYYLDVSKQLSWIYQISGIKPNQGNFIGKSPFWITPTATKKPTPTPTLSNRGR